MSFWQDARFGLRMLLRSPLFTGVAALTLGLGIGANTAIFSVVNAVLLRPLPFGDPGRLVMLWETASETGEEKSPVAPADYYDWRSGARSLMGLAAFHPWSYNFTGMGDPERVSGAVATASLFEVLGRRAALGRVFRAEEEGGAQVAVLGYGFWQRRFGRERSAVGRRILLDDVPYTVIGVMPADFDFPGNADLWTPFDRAAEGAIRDFQFLRVIGRLAPDASLVSARAEMSALAARLAREYPKSNTGRGVHVLPLREQVLGKVQPRLLILIGGVVLMLIAACFNVANLLLARAIGRREETSVRQALGASRGRLVRQFLTESLLLALLGGIVGLLFAYWGVRFLVSFGPAGVPRLDQADVDGAVLAFTLITTVVVGLVFGLIPAIQGSGFEMNRHPRRRRARLLGTLVSVQIAIALMLLVGAMLLARSFLLLSRVPPGFAPQNVLTMQISLPTARYGEPHQAAAFADQVLERIQALPGVVAAGTTLSLPIAGGMDVDQTFTLGGEKPQEASSQRTALLRPVSPGYFQALQIPVVRGRAFTAADRAGAPPVVVVNEAMARHYWPGRNPVGQRIDLAAVDLGEVGRLEAVPREVVGVVGDVKHPNLRSEAAPEIYLPAAQGTWRFLVLAVRTGTDPVPFTPSVLEAIWQLDKNLPVTKVRTMEEILSDSIGQPRFYTLLLSAFATVALTLAAVGIYGLVSYSVSQRRHEIGVRMALGAGRRDVVRMVIREGVVLAAIGILAGVVLSMGLTRFLSTLLFGIGATDLPTFLAVCVTLAAVALLSSYLPARRAAKVDPMVSLRLD